MNNHGTIITEILEKGDLFWNVEKQPLTLPSGEATPFYGTVRTDTNQTFAAVKEGYEIFQNWELAETVHKLAEEKDFTIGNCGSFKGGGKVYVQLNMADKDINGTTLKRHLTALNSHDASHGLKFGTGNTDIWCSNTFQSASRELGRAIKHTKSMKDMVASALDMVAKLEVEEESLLESFMRLADKKIDMFHPSVQKVVQAAVEVDITKNTVDARADYSSRKINQAQDLVASIEMEMGRRDATLWSLFCGYTHYSTHKAGTEKSRVESKMTGSLQKTDNKVLSLLETLV